MTPMWRFAAALGGPVVCAWALGCNPGSTVSGSVPTTVSVSSPSHSLAAIGDTLQLTAQVLDQAGRPIPGAMIIWTSQAPQVASVTGGVVTAVANGVAPIVATSGSVEQSVPVSVRQLAATLTKVSGDSQQGVWGQGLPQSLVVAVRDSNGHPIPIALLQFTIAGGGGSFTTSSLASDSLGHAAASWSLGDTLGVQRAVATLNLVAISDTFVATAIDGLDPLTPDSATAYAAADLATSASFAVLPSCGSSPAINCPGGMAGSPVSLGATRESLTVVPLGAGVFGLQASLAVATPQPIPFEELGLECGMTINSAEGSVSTIGVTATLSFGRLIPGDSVNQIVVANVSIDNLEAGDIAITGGIACAGLNLGLSFVEATVVATLEADMGGNYCGAPGPDLLGPCPVVPGPVAPRAPRRLRALVTVPHRAGHR